MNGIGPEEAGRMTYWQYTAMRHVWNERHRLEGDDDTAIELPDVEFVRERQKELARLGITGKVH